MTKRVRFGYRIRNICVGILALVPAAFLLSCGENRDEGTAEFQQGMAACAEQSYADAADWFLAAAKKGHAGAQMRIADCYREGRGVKRDGRQEFKWYSEAAKQGIVEAWYRIGVCYAEGRGAGKDPAAAVNWYRKAADMGCADAQYALGESCKYGKGVSADTKAAAKWYRKAAETWRKNAEQGDAEAQYKYGACLSLGVGVERKDGTEAANWYRKAAEQGYADAQYRIGLDYGANAGRNSPEAVKAAEWYRKAAEQGHAKAQFELGKCCEEGRGGMQDFGEAVKWYRKAADLGIAEAQARADALRTPARLQDAARRGSVEAMFELGVCFETGNGIPKDQLEAVKWYRKAAEQGSPEAQFKLAEYYGNGIGVNRDEAEALNWYRKAAEQGVEEAQFHLGMMYRDGQGVERDYATAYHWLGLAAEKGHAEAGTVTDALREVIRLQAAAEQADADAMFRLGMLFEAGNGIPGDKDESTEWYWKAAEQGHAEAQCRMGDCCFNGIGVTKDELEAANWWYKAAEQGIALAQYRLGECYSGGRGVAKDETEAIKWYGKAAEQGNADSLKAIQKYADGGNPEAQAVLGAFYLDGKENVIFRDQNRALQLFYLAAGQGNRDGMNHLHDLAGSGNQGAWQAILALSGSGNPEALNSIRNLAEGGNPDAMFYLGECYFNGYGVTKDEMEAVKWIRYAAEQGHAGASQFLRSYWSVNSNPAETRSDSGSRTAINNRESRPAETSGGTASSSGRTATAMTRVRQAQLQTADMTIFLPGNVTLNLVKIVAGSFEMSAKDGMNERDASETAHVAVLRNDFFIGQTEITQAQWRAVMGTNPSKFTGDDLPVENVSWNEAMSFCEKLNSSGKASKGWKFTLPTETQWEYAARGGKKNRGCMYSGSSSINEVAWYRENSGDKTHPVGQKKANELGLYDMSGNVREWCLDNWNEPSYLQKAEFSRGNDTGGYRTFRGGSWSNGFFECRSASRKETASGYRFDWLGFRVALVPVR